MESKVSQNGDISIEEMIDKLRKDYQEEISVSEENKQQLQLLGERLSRNSPSCRAADIQSKLSKVNERWRHLLDLKLRETLVAVQQLDRNMNSLRCWLAHIETELSRPLVFESCDANEIQRKLDLQQKHSTGVASVLNLCEVLLHDCDACSTDAECDSIQSATRCLDRRWRSICALSMERRLRIEETWRLWQKFLEDFSRFEEWLVSSERTAALPNSSGVLYTVAKEEMKKFESFQRQVHESLTQLELINKQYRRLARENRTDTSSLLREKSQGANLRWDALQRRVNSILRRLKHFTGQREDFETSRDSILVWLTEMDLQLTNIEHFSECDIQAKIKQLREISLTTGRISQIFQQGEALMEKSEPLDSAVMEEELGGAAEVLPGVFGRVERYYRKLIRLPLADDDTEVSLSDRELDLMRRAMCLGVRGGAASVGTACCRPSLSACGPECVPVNVYFADVEIPESPEAFVRVTEQTLRSSSASADAPPLSGADQDASYLGYMRLLGECRGSIDTVRKMGCELKEEEEGGAGLIDPSSESQTSGVIEHLLKVCSWLGGAEEELQQQRRLEVSSDIRDIQQRIHKLKVPLSEFLHPDSEESRELTARLKDMNNSWERLGGALEEWRAGLQGALMQCQDFHEMSHGLLLWLENIDRRRNQLLPLDPGRDRETLQDHHKALTVTQHLHHKTLTVTQHLHHKTLTVIRQELLDSQLKVSSLQDMSLQLLVHAQGSDCLEAKEKVHVIGNRLKLLLKEVTRDLREISRVLEISSSQQVQDEMDLFLSGAGSGSSRSDRFPGGSAARGSEGSAGVSSISDLPPAPRLPQLLLPLTEEDYCSQSNNFLHSFSPMLSYTNPRPSDPRGGARC
ncbi:Nesprin-2 [Dissostichus eleginoides]|uniref:Nesprin-2 n=1 Tax=Dissostichus eleginoides TaxID=100907 RepID=A0AAD9C517_DISEL|nr:Nesprin-2 [Dissostichus eleginoides]